MKMFRIHKVIMNQYGFGELLERNHQMLGTIKLLRSRNEVFWNARNKIAI